MVINYSYGYFKILIQAEVSELRLKFLNSYLEHIN
jgi:hypothetical protein